MEPQGPKTTVSGRGFPAFWSLGLEPSRTCHGCRQISPSTDNSQAASWGLPRGPQLPCCMALLSNESFLGLHVACSVLCPWHTPMGSTSRHRLIDSWALSRTPPGPSTLTSGREGQKAGKAMGLAYSTIKTCAELAENSG